MWHKKSGHRRKFTALNSLRILIMDAKLKKFLFKSSIDSFKYRIEIENVQIVNRNLLDCLITQTVNTATGEIINSNELKLNSLKAQFDFYHIHFAINNIFGKRYLVILINSKLLEKDYLNGISMSNIEIIYNRIISAKIINISFQDFLSKGLVSDIDIKKDFELTTADFRLVIDELENKTKPHKKSKYGCNSFKGEINLGIEWNKRENATATRPFLKLYHKEIEAKHGKNKEYFYNHIHLDSVKNVVRCEATIKTAKELKIHGIDQNTLLALLNVSEKKLTEIIIHAIDLNLEPRITRTEIKNKSEFKAIETIIFAHITNMISNQNISFENALEYTLNHFLDKQSKYRAKKQITLIYETHINGKISETKAKKFEQFFTNFGWVEKPAI